jgi:1-acyl-sn-glycerol-3-phosphate acyltransferase
LAGWKLGPVVEDVPKCVICVAPHTSNWDFIVGKLFYTSIGRNASFLIKKEWFFFPFNLLFDWLGGVPVDRSKRTSVTDQMVGQFNRRKEFQLAVTPEGTRKRVNDWKKGFYYIAQKANVPILMAYFDYKKKEVGFKGVFYPTGDADTFEIK